MKKIVWVEDGQLRIMHPVLECGLTLDEIIAKDVPPGVQYKVMDAAEVPADRTFRNAWSLKSDKIEVDMPRAVVIHMARLRTERDRRLKELDKDTMKHLGDPVKLKAVEDKKQALRDAPAALQVQAEACKTPEELIQVVLGD